MEEIDSIKDNIWQEYLVSDTIIKLYEYLINKHKHTNKFNKDMKNLLGKIFTEFNPKDLNNIEKLHNKKWKKYIKYIKFHKKVLTNKKLN